MARRRRRGNSWKKLLAKAALGAALLALIYFLITNYLFVVRRVDVVLPEGSRFTPQQAAGCTNLRVGTRLDRVDRESVASALRDTGWLVLEDLRVQYPDCVRIEVSERRPAALVSHGGTLLVTDAEGIMIAQVSGDAGYEDCLYVTEMDIRRAQPGQALQSSSSGKMEAMTALLQALEEVPCRDLIARASIESARNIKLYSVNHVWVEMGDKERMADKLRLTEAALTDMIAKQESLGTLNVSGGRYADYAPNE